jgi:hypothetical protein
MSCEDAYQRLVGVCRTIVEDERLDLCGHQEILAHALREADRLYGPLSDPSANGVGPYVAGSSTSREAAWDNYPRSGTQRERILSIVYRRGDATRDELAATMPDSSVDPRVLELIRGGWLYETVQTRPTRTGSQAVVLALTAKALDVMRSPA